MFLIVENETGEIKEISHKVINTLKQLGIDNSYEVTNT